MVDLIVGLLEVQAWNTGLWGSLIGWFDSWIGSFGWTIILFTIAIKIVLLPLDFFQRKVAKKNADLQKIVAPELDKVKAKYANKPELLRQKMNEKQMEVYKKQNYNMVGSCVIMLVNLAITMIVFITLFTGLNTIGNIQIANQYELLRMEYTAVYEDTNSIEQAQAAVLELYNSGDVAQSWLWIKNVWRSDTSASSVPSYNEYLSLATVSTEDLSEADYLLVMQPIIDQQSGWNGLYLLVILAGLISYLSAIASTGGFKKAKNPDGTAVAPQAGGKVMKIILPALMVLITLFYNAIFSLYIVTNALFSLISIPVFNKIFEVMDKKKKSKNEVEVEYKIKKYN